jgi:hypothetical protein
VDLSRTASTSLAASGMETRAREATLATRGSIVGLSVPEQRLVPQLRLHGHARSLLRKWVRPGRVPERLLESLAVGQRGLAPNSRVRAARGLFFERIEIPRNFWSSSASKTMTLPLVPLL